MSQQAPRPRVKPEMVAAIGGLLVGIAAIAGLFVNAQDNGNPTPATKLAPATIPPTATSGPEGSPTTQDAGGYQLVYRDRPLVLSTDGCGGSGRNAADFDAPRVFFGTAAVEDVEIVIFNCPKSSMSFTLNVGSYSLAPAAMSVAPDATRSPGDCATAVETQPATKLHKPRLPQSLCLRTSDGAIALVRLLRFRSDLDPQTLSVTASLWMKP